MYLGLDLSLSNTGVAVITGDSKIYTTSITTDTKDYLTLEARITYIVGQIVKVIEEYDIKYIVFEGYAFGSSRFGSNNLTSLAELKGVILHHITNTHKDIQFVTVTTQQMKKYVTGKGIINVPKNIKAAHKAKYKKQVVLDAVNSSYNLKLESFDEADAFGLALICRHLFTGYPVHTIDCSAALLNIQLDVMEVIVETRNIDLAEKAEKQEKINKRELKKAKIAA